MRPGRISMLLRSWRDSLSLWWTEDILGPLGLYDDGFAITTVSTRKMTRRVLIDIRTCFAYRRTPWVTARVIGEPSSRMDIVLTSPPRLRCCCGGQGLDETDLGEVLEFVKLNRDLLLEFWEARGEIDSEELIKRLKRLPDGDSKYNE